MPDKGIREVSKMRSHFLLLILTLFSFIAYCNDIVVKSKIDSVELFSDRAIVERVAQVEIPSGDHKIIFEGITPFMSDNSLKVSGKGSAVCEILGSEIEEIDIDLPEIKQLEKALTEIEVEKRKIDSQSRVLTKQEEVLDTILTNSTTHSGKEIAEGKPDMLFLDRFFSFVSSKYDEINKNRLELNKKSLDIDNKKKELTRQLSDLKAKKALKGKRVTVLIKATTGGEMSFYLDYTVRGCSWSPAYIIKAIPDESKVELSSIASVIQKTYEDWNDAIITLSSATQSNDIFPPELKPTFIDIYSPEQIKQGKRTSSGVEGGVLGREMETPKVQAETSYFAPNAVADKIPPQQEKITEANYSNAELKELGVNVNFHIKGRVDVPSDGKAHKFYIGRNFLDTKFDYFACPRLDDKAFMRGECKNTTDYPLLPGEVEVFFKGEMVGSANMPFLARNEEIETYFGKNKEIKLKFEEVKREKKATGFLTNKEKIRIQNKISVENFTKNEIKIEIVDKIPKPKKSEIEITDVKLTPEKESDKTNGILNWVLTLKPQEKKEITIDFTVEYPKGATLTGL